jgi:hypothetical protein
MRTSLLAFVSAALAVVASPTSSIYGAAYFMTNDEHGNNIIAHTINKDGTVNYASKTYTGGQGTRMVQYSDTGIDALLGQGAIAQDRGNLYVVNPASHSLSMLSIDKNDPSKLTLVGKPVMNGLEFPNSVAVNKNNGVVCATWTGKFNGVECFRPTGSGLKAIPNSKRSLNIPNQTTPANFESEVSTSNIVFSEDGSKLFIVFKGTHGPEGAILQPGLHGFMMLFHVNKDGSLSTTSTITTVQRPGLLPFAAVPIPGTQALAVVDPTSGGEIWDFSKGDTAEIQYVTIPTNKMVCWLSYSPTTGHYFATDFDVGQIIELSIDKSDLKMNYVQSYQLGATTQPIDNAIGTLNGQDFLYQLAPNTTSVAVMQLKAGASSVVQHYNFATEMNAANVTFDINFVQGMAVYMK